MIIDAHIHLISRQVRRLGRERREGLNPRLAAIYNDHWNKHLSRSGDPMREEEIPELKVVAGLWEKELEDSGVAAGVFLYPSDFNGDDMKEFVSYSPRFIGLSSHNPTLPEAEKLFAREIDVLKGFKLYPELHRYHADDERCFPVYKLAEEKGIPVYFHFGICINVFHDIKYGNPLSLSGVCRNFPDLKIVVCHFGCNYFENVLLLGRLYPGIHVDTSSSNNWTEILPYRLTLEEVFQKSIDILGPHRIIFGTDSSFFPRGFRKNILDIQREIMEKLGLSESDKELILSGNIIRLLNLDYS
ncbi:MAG: amidohydrolase family protein [bacterium]